MADTTPLLPEFDRPPVVETVLSAQFEPVAGMRTVHFGLFWQRMREQFPNTEEKPAIEPALERFGERPKPRPPIRFQTREDLHPERIWFVDQAGNEMIQVQVDRFIKNWRKTGENDIYPRYEKVIRPGFLRDFRQFEDFVAEESLGAVKVNQCEVTYVNHIVAGEGWETWSDAAGVFSFLGSVPNEMEDSAFLLRMAINDGGMQVGRLHVEIQPALRKTDEQPMYVMNLTARGMVGSGTDFFDLGRRAVVSTFASLTTTAMHDVWGRKQ